MGQTCNGICHRLKADSFTNKLRYKIGQKWCSLYALFFITEENSCPCCKTRLRTKPRSKKYELRGM